MTSPMRAVVVGVAAGVVVAGALMYRDADKRLAPMQDEIAGFVASPQFTPVRAECETAASSISTVANPTPGDPPYTVYAYDGEFHPASASAPAFPASLSEAMRGKISAAGHFRGPDGTGVEVGLATPWRMGPCALMLVRLPPKPGESLSQNLMDAAFGFGVAVLVAAAMLPLSRARGARRA